MVCRAKGDANYNATKSPVKESIGGNSPCRPRDINPRSKMTRSRPSAKLIRLDCCPINAMLREEKSPRRRSSLNPHSRANSGRKRSASKYRIILDGLRLIWEISSGNALTRVKGRNGCVHPAAATISSTPLRSSLCAPTGRGKIS